MPSGGAGAGSTAPASIHLARVAILSAESAGAPMGMRAKPSAPVTRLINRLSAEWPGVTTLRGARIEPQAAHLLARAVAAVAGFGENGLGLAA